MNISHKLCVPALQQACLTFLLTHAAGKPIKAMRIAELFEEEELYRESSRFVLDNPGGWSEEELSTLSQETLLKLEKRCANAPALASPSNISHTTVFRRNWFLERVLKLGLTPLAKEYQCVRRALSLSLSPVHLHSSRFGSARLAQTQRIAPVCSKRSGGRRTTPSLDSVRVPPSIPVFALQTPDTPPPFPPLA